MTVLPVEVEYGRVRGKVILAVIDSPDPDEQPDAVPAVGTITFTPEFEGGATYPGLSGVLVVPQPIPISLDPDGSFDEYLVATSGNPDDWTYRVTFALGGVKIPAFSIAVPPGSDQLINEWLPAASSTGVLTLRGPRGANIISSEIIAGDLVLNLDDGTDINVGELPVGPGGSNAGVASYIGVPGPTDDALSASYAAIAKRTLSLRDAPGIDWTGATDSAAAVQSFITSAGAGSTIDIDLRSGIVRCDSAITLLAFQHLRGGAQKAGGGPTAATFDFSRIGATATAIDASAGSCQISDVHIVGPGSNNTASKGFVVNGSGGSAITLTHCTAQRFGDGCSLTAQYYATLTDCEFIYNRVGLRLSSCYNITLLRPKIYCSGTDGYKGIGIITGTARGLNVIGGSIEDYGSIVGYPDNAGIIVGSGALVSVRGTYFEAPGATNAVAIDCTTATGYTLDVSACEVYLINHRAFIDAEGGTSAGTVNSGGNQFNCSASTTPAEPIIYLFGTNPGIVVSIGVSELDSLHGVSLATVIYINNQGAPTDRQTVRVPRELLSGSGQGGFFLGDALRTLPSAATKSGLRVPHGIAPTTPVNGDMWTTTAGLFVRINGVTVGPLS